ncbi:MAG: MBL fold metallo-hydrolase, partial [Alistipes sp.]|nr:MBL fold metallo-hydrolase [Alistipes sp.]
MKIITFLICLLAISCSPKDKVGKAYNGWKEGDLDIHFIYTGRGEANFYIFPDGTTMLVDAGDHQATVPMTDPKPNLSRRGGEWVARYIERVNPHTNKVDYFMLSHYHNDHMGSADLD